jgi:hypothetical protein
MRSPTCARCASPAILRSAEEFKKLGGYPRKDGTVPNLRLVPTSRGLAISITQCASCHVRTMPDGSQLDGAPTEEKGNALLGELARAEVRAFFKGDSLAMVQWRSFAVPWIANDIHDGLKTMPPKELVPLFSAAIFPGVFPRFNSSVYFPPKIPDLIGVGERKYFDATATHRQRNPEDIARYAALVTCCDVAEFGPHHMLSDEQPRRAKSILRRSALRARALHRLPRTS